MTEKMKWRRKKDGVEVTTAKRMGWDQSHQQTRAERVDNGHSYWVSWDGLRVKYDLIEGDA